jgi:hypothetical protein
VSSRVGGEFARQDESVRELALVIRPVDDQGDQQERLAIPVRAYLASIYGDRPTPRLTVEVQGAPPDGPGGAETTTSGRGRGRAGESPELVLDWMTETVLLQILQEALHNVWRHSRATAVEVAVHPVDTRVALRVTDDGVGFDPASVPEGSGITTMRAAAAVGEGTLVVRSEPGRGTTVLAHLGPDQPPHRRHPAAGGSESGAATPTPPKLRIVPDA